MGMPAKLKQHYLTVAIEHRPGSDGSCHGCGQQDPCHRRLDAIHHLIWGGVDPAEYQ
jgi:hypothetical protein